MPAANEANGEQVASAAQRHQAKNAGRWGVDATSPRSAATWTKCPVLSASAPTFKQSLATWANRRSALASRCTCRCCAEKKTPL